MHDQSPYGECNCLVPSPAVSLFYSAQVGLVSTRALTIFNAYNALLNGTYVRVTWSVSATVWAAYRKLITRRGCRRLQRDTSPDPALQTASAPPGGRLASDARRPHALALRSPRPAPDCITPRNSPPKPRPGLSVPTAPKLCKKGGVALFPFP